MDARHVEILIFVMHFSQFIPAVQIRDFLNISSPGQYNSFLYLIAEHVVKPQLVSS